MNDQNTHSDTELPDFLREIAFQEINETPELRAAKLIELKESINALTQPDEKIEDLSDRNLIRFLRSRKYDVQRALESTIKWQKFYHSFRDILKDFTQEEARLCSNFLEVIHEVLTRIPSLSAENLIYPI